MLRYTLGLDIGIASVGWAVLQNNMDGEPIKIERLGVRIFDSAEQPKTGASLAAPRREARGQRRTVRRRRHRKERIKWLIEQQGIMTCAEMEEMFQHPQFEHSVYELRVEALERALTKEEFVRVLIHLAQRRGYKSNSKSEEAKDKENGVVKTAISKNEACMRDNGYRTVGEMLWKDTQFWETNPDGSKIFVPHNHPNDYRATVTRSMVESEIELIFKRQRELGVPYAAEELEQAYRSIWSSQRNFDEGPGGDSRYGGNMIEKMLGHCTYEANELRAAKGSYSAEYFRVLQDVNHLRLVKSNGESTVLTNEQRQSYIDLVMKSANATYGQLRKELALPDDVFFNMLRYGSEERKKVESKKLGHMKFYHEMRKALNRVQKDAISTVSWEDKDKIARILLCYKSDDNRREKLFEGGIPEEFIAALLPLSTSKTAHLSAKALRKLIPHLEDGLSYTEARKEVYGEDKSESKKNKLSLYDIEPINNPVVRRAVSQTIRVINAIVREYGAPEVVRVELAREMGKPFDVRKKIMNQQEVNAKNNERLKEEIREIKKSEPTGQDIVKMKLFQEQKGVCLYSGANLDIAQLFSDRYAEVDHIIPYSISYDDSYTNKVLVLARENQQKGNRLPFEYLQNQPERWQRFETLVDTRIFNWKKKRNLLTQSLSEERRKGFKQRNLVDTQYISRVVYHLINDHLQFAETGKYAEKRRTQSVNGAITAEVRKRLGIQKIREDGDLHHAADAAIVACISPGMVQKITKYAQHRELIPRKEGYLDIKTGELLTREEYEAREAKHFPAPWERFRQELEARLSDHPAEEIAALRLPTYDSEEELQPVFVSRKQTHKVTGAAHKETIRSAKMPGNSISKKDLTSLRLDKNGEIEGYYAPESDTLLYEALKKRLTEFGGDAKKAFAEPFYKPKSDGTRGPLVKKVKIYETSTLSVPVHGGQADNGGMIRVDVFYIEGDGYYYVPVYTADVVRNTLPNRAVVAHKPQDQWRIMQDENFLFSMYPNDLIYIESKKGVALKAQKGSSLQEQIVRKESLYYFKGMNISTGNLSVITHDHSYEQLGLGGKRLSCLKKYTVDVLGNYSEVPLPEKRKGLRE